MDAVCAVWNAHHAAAGVPTVIDPLRLEWFCLAKPYFDGRHLLLAEDQGRVVGWLHYGPFSDPQMADLSHQAIGISAFCVDPIADSEIALELLDHCLKSVPSAVEACYFRPLLPHCGFYLGLGPADSMVGATTADARVCEWIQARDFAPVTPACQWELDLSRFQAPVDRQQIQIRRSTLVHRQVDEPLLPWWQACILGHTEPTSFQLTHRAQRRVLGEILMWAISPEIQALPESVVWLWPPATPDEQLDEPQLLFLLAEALRELQAERIDCVRTVSLADETSNTSILRKLGFNVLQNGMVFRREMRTTSA